jgi:SNF2 family DNA or RNA helicase
MWTPDHRYEFEITENDPIALQPESIKTALKPHQLASLHKAMVMERQGNVSYSIPSPEQNLPNGSRRPARYRGNYRVHTNIGILGDIIGYGKTLLALSIAASTPTTDIYTDRSRVYAYHASCTRSSIRVHCEEAADTDTRELFNSTLVIVPRGPVYKQWENTLKENTTLRYLAIDDLRVIKKKCPVAGSTHETLCSFFSMYDIVLIKNTTLLTLIDHYDVPFHTNPIRGFNRIMIDEAHDIMNKVPMLDCRFMWYITATFRSITSIGSGAFNMTLVVRELLNEERVYNILVKCSNSFTKSSFVVPSYKNIVYRCSVPRMVSIVQPFLSQNVLHLVNANDIEGAMRELGGATETKENIIHVVTRNIQRDIFNREREREYVNGLDMPEDARTSRLRLIDTDIGRLEQKKRELEERIQTMTENACPICYELPDTPVILTCTHTFCGGCIMKWIGASHNQQSACPTCRNPIMGKSDLTFVVQDNRVREATRVAPEEVLTKPKWAVRIIQQRPEGRFLIFSQFDNTFIDLVQDMTELGITHSDLKGTTQQMIRTLERFKAGEIRVILLNTQYAGCGIDISCATDVILFHTMDGMSDQAIGRAQRVGRTTPLTVHRLCYPHEIVA